MIYKYPLTTIYRGDFRGYLEYIPGEAIVVTDPPYNIGFKYDEYSDNLPEQEYVEMLGKLRRFQRRIIIHYPAEMMRYVVPALGVPDHIGAWCYNVNTPRQFRLIAYYGMTPDYQRIRQPYKNPGHWRIRERNAAGSMDTRLSEWWTDIQLVTANNKNPHPCPIPEALARRIIALCANNGDTIFDPFAGSGTVLAAAQSLGHHSVGCELSAKYIDMMAVRLTQEPMAIWV